MGSEGVGQARGSDMSAIAPKASDGFFLILSQMLGRGFNLHVGVDVPTNEPKLWLSRASDGDETELNWGELKEMYSRGDYEAMQTYVRVLSRCIGSSDEENWDFFQ